MNWFDILSIIILIRTSYIGLKNGLSIEIYKFATFCIACFAAIYSYNKIADIINQNINIIISREQLNAVIFMVLLLAGMLIFRFIFIFAREAIKLSFAKNFDVSSGIILGLIRGVLIVCVIFAVLTWVSNDHVRESIQKRSFSGSYIVKIERLFNSILVKLLP